MNTVTDRGIWDPQVPVGHGDLSSYEGGGGKGGRAAGRAVSQRVPPIMGKLGCMNELLLVVT